MHGAPGYGQQQQNGGKHLGMGRNGGRRHALISSSSFHYLFREDGVSEG